jgi:nucleotide-binding universal stress UspA family protein
MTEESSMSSTGTMTDLADARVVVAADTGPAAALALAWAADESLCRGMPVRLVTAFADNHGAARPRTVEQALACQRRLRDQIRHGRPWLEDVEQIVRRGSLMALLTEAARATDLIVVGANSVTPNLLDHAPCPVVIVPAPADAAGDEGRPGTTATSSSMTRKR